jgi:RimJ/RimL family protein N-acetyltransferase
MKSAVMTNSRPAIRIRPYTRDDADVMLEAVDESRVELNRWMPWCEPGYGRADALEWIEMTIVGREKGTLFDFAIVDGRGRYFGGAGINQIRAAEGVANVGYWVRSSATGAGIAVAAARQVIDWGIANTRLNRFEIVAAVENRRSQRVAEKLGAVRDAVLRKRLLVDGIAVDAVLYSVLRPD